MRTFKRFWVLLLAMLLFFLASCTKPETPSDDTTLPPEGSTSKEPEASTAEPPVIDPDKNPYNIIFALASIPPVLAAIDSIGNGYPTYAIIERGKTYNGIEKLENFHNAGFDPNNNLSTGFTQKEFDDMTAKVKEILENDPDAFFTFYVQDGTALRGAALAANAGLKTNQFHIYMCEDGTGAYHALSDKYIAGKTVTAEQDGVYENYVSAVESAQKTFDEVMAKTDNKNADAALRYNIGLAFALASLPNFTYYLQDERWVVDILENTGDTKTKLLSAFGVEGYTEKVDYQLHLKYQKISDGIALLSEAQKTDYLTLMYGDFYEGTYTSLTRTERAGEQAPAKKLVFIGSRHNLYPHFATGSAYGIGGLATTDTLPKTYAELDAKYKSPLLFASEADYTLFLAEVNRAENYVGELTDDVKEQVKVAAFNLYIDYIFTLKLTYALYGETYDLIMKGHPREAIGSYGEWGNRYKVPYGDGQNYVYDKLLDNLLLAFHAGDSTGKYIGMVPYGTSAENLAYLGADIAIAGLPSSTYSGFDTDVDVVFIMAETDEDIAGSGKAEAASQVKLRYEAGNLLYTDKNGEKKTAVFYNTGNVYKYLAAYLKAGGNTALASEYEAKYKAWLSTVHANATDIDDQGFALK